MTNIDKDNWCINVHEEGLTEDQVVNIYYMLDKNYETGEYWFRTSEDNTEALFRQEVHEWDLIGVINGFKTIEVSTYGNHLVVPKITYNDFEKYILNTGDAAVSDQEEIQIEVGQVYRKTDPCKWTPRVKEITVNHVDDNGNGCDHINTYFVDEKGIREGKFVLVKSPDELVDQSTTQLLINKNLLQFCTDTGGFVKILSDEEVWIKWNNRKWNVANWSDDKVQELIDNIRWLESASGDRPFVDHSDCQICLL